MTNDQTEQYDPSDYIELSSAPRQNYAAGTKTGMLIDSEDGPVDPGQFVGKVEPSRPSLSAGRGRPWATPGLASSARDTANRLRQRESWHDIGAPEDVEQAWQLVLSESAAVEQAAADLDRVTADANAAWDAEASRVREQVAMGQTPRAKATGEPSSEQRHRSAVLAGVLDRASTARERYDHLVSDPEVRERWRAGLAEALPADAQQVEQAARTLAEQLEQVRRGCDVLGDLSRSQTKGRRPLPTRAALDVTDLSREAEQLADYAVEPVEQVLRPSRYEREQIVREQSYRVSGCTCIATGIAAPVECAPARARES